MGHLAVTRLVDIRLVLDRNDRLQVSIDGRRFVPRGLLAMALHEVARALLPLSPLGAVHPLPCVSVPAERERSTACLDVVPSVYEAASR